MCRKPPVASQHFVTANVLFEGCDITGTRVRLYSANMGNLQKPSLTVFVVFSIIQKNILVKFIVFIKIIVINYTREDVMNFRELEYLTEIAKHGNISRAAEALYVSQPTLSVFLRKLEENIGTPLFERIGKGLLLTYAGTLYLSFAQEVLARERQLQNELSSVIAEQRGRIRVGMHKKRTLYLVPAVLMEFRDRYPNIEVAIMEVDSLDMERMLLSGELDLAICNRYFSSDRIQTVNIYEDRLLCVTCRNHPAAAHAVPCPGQPYPYMDLNCLADETFILQSPEQSTRVFTDYALAYANVKPQKRLVIENMDTASQLAAEGYGVAFTTKSYANFFSYHKPVDYYMVGDLNTYFNIFIARTAFSTLPAYGEYFIDLVKRYINNGGIASQ